MKLALGTAQFGLDYGISNARGKIPRNEVFEILFHAMQHEINTLDTAYAYGDSERVIGEFIEENSSSFRIISKLPATAATEVEAIFEESLKRLHVKRMYAYLVHDFKLFRQYPQIWESLAKIKHDGRVEKIGFSLYHPDEAHYLIDNRIKFDIAQVPFSIFDQRFKDIFPLLKMQHIEIHVRSVFLQGLVFKDPERLGSYFDKIKAHLELLREISKRDGIPISAICLNFALINPHIDKVVIGIDNINNLKDNFANLRYQETMRSVVKYLREMNQTDENIVLPYNWPKEIK